MWSMIAEGTVGIVGNGRTVSKGRFHWCSLYSKKKAAVLYWCTSDNLTAQMKHQFVSISSSFASLENIYFWVNNN